MSKELKSRITQHIYVICFSFVQYNSAGPATMAIYSQENTERTNPKCGKAHERFIKNVSCHKKTNCSQTLARDPDTKMGPYNF